VAARAGRALEGMLARGFTTIRDVGGGDVGLARAHEAGIPIVYGTDLFADVHDHQLEEFIIRSEVQPPADLIRAATSTAGFLDGEAPGRRSD